MPATLFSLPKLQLIKGYKWPLLPRSQNFPLFEAGEYLVNKLGETMAGWLNDNPQSMWLPGLYLALSTAVSNPWTWAKRLLHQLSGSLQVVKTAHRNTSPSTQPPFIWRGREKEQHHSVWCCWLPTSPGFNPLQLSQPGWASFRGRSKKRKQKRSKQCLQKGRTVFCICVLQYLLTGFQTQGHFQPTQLR